MENFIWNQYTERLAMLTTKNIKICGRITKLKAYQQKFEFIFSQGSVAKCQRWDGYCRMGFVPNFIRFPTVQKFWKSVKIWQSYRTFKGRSFFETQCILYHKMSLRPHHETDWSRIGVNRAEIFKLWSFLLSKFVNNVCKLLQLLGFAPERYCGTEDFLGPIDNSCRRHWLFVLIIR